MRADTLPEKESARRSLFMLSSGSPGDKGAGSSSAEGTIQSGSSSGVEEPIGLPLGFDISAAVEAEVTQSPGVTPQLFEATRAVSPQSPIPIDGQPPTAPFQYSGSDSGSLIPTQTSETPMFVTPQQVFAPPRSIESDKDAVVSQMVTDSPLVTPPPVLEFSQTVAPRQISNCPTTPEHPHLVAPLVLDAPQAVVSHQAVASPIISESPPLATPYPVLEPSQAAVPHQAITSPIVNDSPSTTTPPTVLEPPTVVDTQEFANQHQILGPPQVTHDSQINDNSGAVVATGGGYRLRDQASVAAATRSRRDSMEGAPDIMLTLGVSGYELLPRLPQPDISSAPPSAMPSSTVLPPDELAAPSSQQSPGDPLTTPMDVDTTLASTPRTDEPPPVTLYPSPEEPSTTPTVSGTAVTTPKTFYSAPRIVPTYSIDRSDLPSWLSERGRLDYVLSVEAGDIWAKLIATWFKQERKLGFGISENIVCERFRCPPRVDSNSSS